jgi:hypothetical protein
VAAKGTTATLIADLKEAITKLGSLDPDPRLRPGKPFSEKELSAFEQRHAIVLPPQYRAYLLAIGDGGVGFACHFDDCGGIYALRDVGTKAAMARAKKKTAFAKAASRKAIAKLRAGMRYDDGTIPIGVTSDHCLYQLVITGPHADEVWIDSTGQEGGAWVWAPRKKKFLALNLAWMREQIARREQRAATKARLRRGDARSAAAPSKADLAAGREVIEASATASAPDAQACRAAAMLFERAGEHETAERALLAGALWEELFELALKHRKPVKPPRESGTDRKQASGTALTHLVAASVVLGRPLGEAPSWGDHPSYWPFGRKLWHGAMSRLPFKHQQMIYAGLDPLIAVELLAEGIHTPGLLARVPWFTDAVRRLRAHGRDWSTTWDIVEKLRVAVAAAAKAASKEERSWVAAFGEACARDVAWRYHQYRAAMPAERAEYIEQIKKSPSKKQLLADYDRYREQDAQRYYNGFELALALCRAAGKAPFATIEAASEIGIDVSAKTSATRPARPGAGRRA